MQTPSSPLSPDAPENLPAVTSAEPISAEPISVAPTEVAPIAIEPIAAPRETPPPVAFEPIRIAPPNNAASLRAPETSVLSATTFPETAPRTNEQRANEQRANEQAAPRGFAPLENAPTSNAPTSNATNANATNANFANANVSANISSANVPVGNARASNLGSLHTLLLGGLLACSLVGMGMLLGRNGAPSSTGNDVAPINIATVDLTSQSAIERAIQRVGPAVMNVDTTFGGGGTKEFLPDPGTSSQPVQGKGTGFVFDSKRGLMLTNAHVVADARKIQVTTRDGKKYTGKILGVDRKSDIAVVVIDNKTLPEAKLAPMKNSRDIQIGQWAIAIGNPFAQANTVTVGVISATGRTIPVPDEKNGGMFQLKDMLQTDAAINPGNSGGPLCNINGEVVGINTAIYGIGTGLGFTIPINKAYAVAQEIIKHGSVQQAFVGLQLQAITAATKQEYGLNDTLGALVQNAVSGSPAQKSGFQAGDIIRKINGQSMKDMKQTQSFIQKQKVGATLKIEILRNNTSKTLTLKTVPQPNA